MWRTMEGRLRRVRIRGGRGRGRGRGREGAGGRGGGQRLGGEFRGRGQGGEEEGGRIRRIRIPDDIRATIVDHVINHGMTLREAGQRVQPNLSRYTVASIIRTFRNENRVARNPASGGRQRMFTEEQETHIVNMVLANNSIRLREIQQRIIEDTITFQNINNVSISALSRVLARNRIRMKQIYRVPFERNSERIKQLRYEYVQVSYNIIGTECGSPSCSAVYEPAVLHLFCLFQRVMELEADAMGHELIYVDEAGFNLTKTRRRGRNLIGQRAIINVPGQRGGNITMCAAMSQNGVVHHHAILGPYNTAHIITFLDTLYHTLTNVQRAEQMRYVIIWDNVSFHRAALVRNWFTDHQLFTVLNLPPYSPFLNPIEEFFSAWRWKVYDRHPHQRMALLQAMEEACEDIDQASCQAWIRHSRRYFPRCLGQEDIACDVDEILWPDPERRHD
ncbi:uncharacterized protein Hap1MRO34_019041 isoform 1-T1 [Clarias gariepinus]|uniref:uncharacterized protein LOC128508309 isoform X1 n=4 Tax=Clarias gariepinus TaxID=13013 RepID=UPI00234D4D67|nr:uncharacterized protein LOC128508309 isoform X1 [Clarias gariepinus]XP_053344064.1 uncharacterized protein LOC128514299 isoform X1 [Clarias gariepinus]XP_053350522.1 uncharacterized protein LOC128520321 isoform X1 [Clarias gariepinus]XP_053353004.1 uncharacterized protein LOC128524453 isoform X1 [Clarias gariepinus]XP_053356811.1 uncharacterized protein LOC128528085 isoform X1 [Clarias gariepinus]XP_053371049.1 uncharacterized protein LOC128544801 isoform X1 [Clarias gariepinus]